MSDIEFRELQLTCQRDRKKSELLDAIPDWIVAPSQRAQLLALLIGVHDETIESAAKDGC
jgi:hypothetical protein